GNSRAWAFYPKSGTYVDLGQPPGLDVSTTAVGVSDGNAVGIDATSCSSGRQSVMRALIKSGSPQWAKPCGCAAFYYGAMGVNSEGIAVEGDHASILTWPHGSPSFSRLPSRYNNVGIMAAGSADSFVG